MIRQMFNFFFLIKERRRWSNESNYDQLLKKLEAAIQQGSR